MALEDHCKDSKLCSKIRCPVCPSLILSPDSAQLHKEMISLPKVQKDAGEEQIDSWWLVDDMFTFDNIGFSKAATGGLKYLTCADCEIGPLGVHDPSDPKKFLIAASRVRYNDSATFTPN
ncbi:Oidioi.mRNA.OKI2018_I69.XSR.g14625.t1.cds [Oikopleura dioica]|uniref:Oidioi.mRNA.OKI2018_I69.XSR.g14625.t1.cds n=1 Tax=Oikopleura dioica TaxID=34765 RepID=A0ABN7SEE1_OIKDI|nr:Oidioi.mRNA.OKI2018_I69.XSR.g14625.t1.cds [Oikopleura dioica]